MRSGGRWSGLFFSWHPSACLTPVFSPRVGLRGAVLASWPHWPRSPGNSQILKHLPGLRGLVACLSSSAPTTFCIPLPPAVPVFTQPCGCMNEGGMFVAPIGSVIAADGMDFIKRY